MGRKLWPLLILAGVGIGFTIYVVEFPTDRIVDNYLSYELVGRALGQHVWMVLVSSVLAVATAVPLGVGVSRPALRLLAPVIINVVNIAQTVPSLAILALFMSLLGVGFRSSIFALWLYSLLPIMRNTYAGLRGVSPDILEAARGMGLTPGRVLIRIELPLAWPIILAGIRTAVIINVGTATLASFVAGGGLGDLIVTGLSLMRYQILLAGAVLASCLAIFLDFVFAWTEERSA